MTKSCDWNIIQSCEVARLDSSRHGSLCIRSTNRFGYKILVRPSAVSIEHGIVAGVSRMSVVYMISRGNCLFDSCETIDSRSSRRGVAQRAS
jgi:hypothetical protein